MSVCKNCGYVDARDVVPRSRLDAVDNEVQELKQELQRVRDAAKAEILRLQPPTKQD